MRKNLKLLIVSCSVSSILFGNISNARNPIQEEIEDLKVRKITTTSLMHMEAAALLDGIESSDKWCIYQTPRLTTEKQIDTYMNTMHGIEKAFQEVGEGTYYPESSGYILQKTGRITKHMASIAWDIAEPFAAAAGVRIVGDIVLSKAGPWVVERAGEAGANMASKVNTWWTKYDPTGWGDKAVRTTAKATAKGETLRNLGSLTYYMETYGGPVIKTAYKATSKAWGAAKGIFNSGAEAVTIAARKVSSWCQGWFGSQKSPDLADDSTA